MKTLRKIGMALLATIIAFSFAACSDDDEPGNPLLQQLEGTWQYNSDYDPDMESGTITFRSNGTAVINDRYDGVSNVTYSLNGNILRVMIDSEDFIEGTIAVDGSRATFRYTWGDIHGWHENASYVMTLTKEPSPDHGGGDIGGSDDDDDETGGIIIPDNPAFNITGTWSYSSSDDLDMDYGTFTFREGGRLTWATGDEVNAGSYFISNDELTIQLDHESTLRGTIQVADYTMIIYTYKWYDTDGYVSPYYTMTMRRR